MDSRVRPRARFCVIFHTKILKNARKSRARVWKTHVEKKKRMQIMGTRLRFQFWNIMAVPHVPIIQDNSSLDMHILDIHVISFKDRSHLRRLDFKIGIRKSMGA